MIAISNPAEQRTVLHNISWDFEGLLRETSEDRVSRFAYECGTLEIMTPLFEHENTKIQFARFIFALVEILEIEIKSAGSTTLKRRLAKRGIEPDNCYYVHCSPAIRGEQTLDLEIDPPPNLALEIDIISSSINKLGIYAALGVPELWRYKGQVLKFYQLLEGKYIECEYSIAFPIVLIVEISRFIEQTKTMGEIALLKSFRSWVKNKERLI